MALPLDKLILAYAVLHTFRVVAAERDEAAKGTIWIRLNDFEHCAVNDGDLPFKKNDFVQFNKLKWSNSCDPRIAHRAEGQEKYLYLPVSFDGKDRGVWTLVFRNQKYVKKESKWSGGRWWVTVIAAPVPFDPNFYGEEVSNKFPDGFELIDTRIGHDTGTAIELSSTNRTVFTTTLKDMLARAGTCAHDHFALRRKCTGVVAHAERHRALGLEH